MAKGYNFQEIDNCIVSKWENKKNREKVSNYVQLWEDEMRVPVELKQATVIYLCEDNCQFLLRTCLNFCQNDYRKTHRIELPEGR